MPMPLFYLLIVALILAIPTYGISILIWYALWWTVFINYAKRGKSFDGDE